MSPGIFEQIANVNPSGFALQNARSALQNQAIQAEIPGIQAKSQQAQLENQITQRSLRDADIIQRAWINSPDDPEGYMIKNGISAPGFMNYRGQVIDLKQKLATTDKTVLENHATQSEQAGNLLREYQANPGPGTWKQAATALDAVHPEAGWSPGVPLDPSRIPGVLAGLGMSKQLTAEALQAQETANKKQEADIKAKEEARQEAARQALGPKATPEERAMTAEERSKERIALGEQEIRRQELEKQTKYMQMSMDARNRQLALSEERNERDAQTFALNMKPLTDPSSPLYGVDPKSVEPARKAVLKYQGDYHEAVNAARDISDFIAEAKQQGSKAAYSMLPTEGSLVLNTSRGTKRINRNEVEAWAGAGSLWDKIKGKAGGIISGADIDNDVLDSFSKLHEGIVNNAAKKLEDNLRSVDSTYRTHYANQAAGGPGSVAPTGGGGVSVQELLKRHGG